MALDVKVKIQAIEMDQPQCDQYAIVTEEDRIFNKNYIFLIDNDQFCYDVLSTLIRKKVTDLKSLIGDKYKAMPVMTITGQNSDQIYLRYDRENSPVGIESWIGIFIENLSQDDIKQIGKIHRQFSTSPLMADLNNLT